MGGSLLSDFGVEKIEKMQNDPPTIKHRRVYPSWVMKEREALLLTSIWILNSTFLFNLTETSVLQGSTEIIFKICLLSEISVGKVEKCQNLAKKIDIIVF